MRLWPFLALAALAACKIEPGASGVAAEFRRLDGQHGFSVLAHDPSRTVFAAKGRQVVLAPLDGLCVSEPSLNVDGQAAFALVADCAGGGARAPTFPGILTVSIAGDGVGDPGTTVHRALDRLDRFIVSEAGTALLGRGTGQPVGVLQTRLIGEGLYALVEDRESPLDLLAPRFWRAFVEIGGRMTMVTASRFDGAPLGDEAMLALLVRQVVALREANAMVPAPDEMTIAGAAEPTRLAYAQPAGAERPATDGAQPAAAPAEQSTAAAPSEAASGSPPAPQPRTAPAAPPATAPAAPPETGPAAPPATTRVTATPRPPARESR